MTDLIPQVNYCLIQFTFVINEGGFGVKAKEDTDDNKLLH